MTQHRLVVVFVALLLAVSACSTSPNPTVVDTDAQPEPSPDAASESVAGDGPNLTEDPEATTTTSTTLPEADPSTEPELDTSPEALDQFATPNGPTLQEITTVAAARDLARAMTGPMDDMSGTAARLGPFPNFPTFNDTVVSHMSSTAVNNYANDGSVESFRFTISIEGTTSATREDTDIAFQATMARAGFEQWTVTDTTFETDDGANLSLTTRTLDDGRTFFTYSYFWLTDANAEFVDSSIQWTENGPFAGGVLEESSISAWTRTNSFAIETWHRFPEPDRDVLQLSEASRLGGSPWVITGDIIGTTIVAVPDVPGEAKIRLTTGAGGGSTIQVFSYEGSTG